MKFSLESIQVSVSQDKENVFISMSILEGEKYTVDEVNIIGDIPLSENVMSLYSIL